MADPAPAPAACVCPACGAPADGTSVSHRKMDPETLKPRLSVRCAKPCGCELDEAQYATLVRSFYGR